MNDTKRKPLNIVIIGIGGVGSALAYKLGRFCQFLHGYETTICLIDGDTYENKNAERQVFPRIGNKAEVTAQEASGQFDHVTFVPFGELLTPDNIDFYLMEVQIILLCVDNNKTKRLVDEHVSAMENVALLSGGNDLTDGSVQLYLRRSGQNRTASLSEMHEEIAHPKDKSPHEMSCEEKAAESEPQLFFANDMVSTLICQVLWNLVTNPEYAEHPLFGEWYFNMKTGRIVPFPRPPSPKP